MKKPKDSNSDPSFKKVLKLYGKDDLLKTNQEKSKEFEDHI